MRLNIKLWSNSINQRIRKTARPCSRFKLYQKNRSSQSSIKLLKHMRENFIPTIERIYWSKGSISSKSLNPWWKRELIRTLKWSLMKWANQFLMRKVKLKKASNLLNTAWARLKSSLKTKRSNRSMTTHLRFINLLARLCVRVLFFFKNY